MCGFCAAVPATGFSGLAGALSRAAPHTSQKLPESAVTDPHDGQFISCQLLNWRSAGSHHGGSADPLDMVLNYGTVLYRVGALIGPHCAVRLPGRQLRSDYIAINRDDG
jgi:hypothetical protein